MRDCGAKIRFPFDGGHAVLPCTQEPHDPVDPHECNGALPDGTVFHLRWKQPNPDSRVQFRLRSGGTE